MTRVVLRSPTFAEVLAHLQAGRMVQVDDFGTFRPSTHAARRIRNPVTKVLMQLPQMHSVKFRPAKFLKELMSEAAR